MNDLTDAIRALNPTELQWFTGKNMAMAAGMADRGEPRIAAVHHALAVLLAEESDRRDEVLDQLDPDRDEVGEIVDEGGRACAKSPDLDQS